MVADKICHSFDHGMMHLLELPFLDEKPPRALEVLTARDVAQPQGIRSKGIRSDPCHRVATADGHGVRGVYIMTRSRT